MNHATIFVHTPANLETILTLLQQGKSVILPGPHQYLRIQGIQWITHCPRTFYIAIPSVDLLQQYTSLTAPARHSLGVCQKFGSVSAYSAYPVLYQCPISHRLALPSLSEGSPVCFMIPPTHTILYRFMMELMMPLVCIPLETKTGLPILTKKHVLDRFEYQEEYILVDHADHEDDSHGHHHDDHAFDSESDDEETTPASTSHTHSTTLPLPAGFTPTMIRPVNDQWEIVTQGLGQIPTSIRVPQDVAPVTVPEIKIVDVYMATPVMGLIPEDIKRENLEIKEYLQYLYDNTLFMDFRGRAPYLRNIIYGYVDMDAGGSYERALRNVYMILHQASELGIRHVVCHKQVMAVPSSPLTESEAYYRDVLCAFLQGLTKGREKMLHVEPDTMEAYRQYADLYKEVIPENEDGAGAEKTS